MGVFLFRVYSLAMPIFSLRRLTWADLLPWVLNLNRHGFIQTIQTVSRPLSTIFFALTFLRLITMSNTIDCQNNAWISLWRNDVKHLGKVSKKLPAVALDERVKIDLQRDCIICCTKHLFWGCKFIGAFFTWTKSAGRPSVQRRRISSAIYYQH